MSKTTKALFRVLDVIMIFVLAFGAPMSALAGPSPTGATITSDLADYPPGATVTLTGAGWTVGEAVHIFVNDDVGQTWNHNSNPDPVADGGGAFTYQFQLPWWFVADYSVKATGAFSGEATTSFTDKPAANLDQCANLGTTCDTGTSSQWQNGNLGQSQATYFEGDSVPYRAVVTGLVAGATYTLKIEYDTTQNEGNLSGKHAIDYLTDFDRTETTADPCSGVAGVPSCASSTFPIPLDGNVSGAGVTQLGAQNFTIYNGLISGVSSYTLSGTYAGSSSTSIIVTFTATADGTTVLAWGGHIATRADWGLNNSAVAISGSPYHMRLVDFTCSNVSNCGVGQQDRSLSAGAVIFPASITIVKAATPEGPTSFPFTATPAPLANFALVDDNTPTNTQVFSGITNFTTYTVAETTPSGWSLTGIVCTVTSPNGGSQTVTSPSVSINLKEGEDVTCTFSNQQQAAQLTLVKTVVNDNGGSATEADFQAYIDASPVPWSTAQTLSPGSYTASESTLAGYTASAWGGDCAADGSVTLAAGQSKTCTVTNDDVAPTLTLVKTVVNDNGGTAVVSDFPLFISGSPATSGTTYTLSAGSYTASETNLDGYTASAWGGDCAADGSVTLGVGDNKTCTITNDDQASFIIVEKVVINDNGGSAAPDDFNLTLDGNATLSGVAVAVNPGTYTAAETQLSGYTFEGFSGDCDANGDVTVALGETKTCTLTNNDQQAYITVIKVVTNDNGGSAAPNDFNLTLEGNAVSSGVTVPVNPGTYTAGETLLAGYTFEGFSGDCDASGDTTVALGESKTCTLTNNDQQASITVIKVVTNDNGGSADPDDFNLTLEGNVTLSGVAVPVNPGTYTAGETLLSGYTFEGFTGDCDVNGDTTVALGEHKTCTLTNNDQQASITVIKVVTNDNGGSAAPDDFDLTLEGNAVSSGVAVAVNPGTYTAGETLLAGYTFEGFSGDCDASGDTTVALGESKTCTLTNNDQQASITVIKVVTNDNGGSADPDDFNLTLEGNVTLSGVAVPVNPGTYTAGETLLSGYTFEGFTGDCDVNGDTTVALGEHKTCTLTNNDIAPKLHLRKVVVNDNGGTATVADFTLTADDPTGSNDLSGTSPVDSGPTLKAGSFYLIETTLPGYAASAWSCNGGVFTPSHPNLGHPNAWFPDSITVGIGEEATCTITNDDVAPKLTLVKTVVNDNGGIKTVADFPLFISGTAATSGTAYTQTANVLLTATETTQTGYTASVWGGDCAANGTITLQPGDNKTCTITNDDVAPKLTLVKTVVNDNGGTKAVSDFPLFINGVAATSGTAYDQSANVLLTASETTQTGYTASVWGGDCAANGTITLQPGDNKTCTITNDDVAPKLTLVKTVVNDNGGTKTVSDFPLFISGTPATSGTAYVQSANVLLTATETTQTGYAASVWGGDCAANGTITLQPGDNKTCTITNNDITAHLKLVKVVVNDNGGTAVAGDWTLVADDDGSNLYFGSGGFDLDVNASTYKIFESALVAVAEGYSTTGFDCGNSVTLALGESKTCTITNDDIAPKLHLRKVVVNDNGGTKTVADFTLTANGTGTNDLSGTSPVDSGAGLKADTWALSETNVYGYTASAWVCVGGTQNGSNITVGIGGEATCTITNDDNPGTIIVKKIIKPVGALTSFSFQTTGDGGANALPDYQPFSLAADQTNTQTLDAGSYTVKELVPLGWVLTGIGGSTDPNTPYACTVTGSGGSTGLGDLNTQTASINLKNGDTVTCVFENTGQGATRTQGFWATHLALAKIAWEGGSGFGHTFPGVANVAGIGDTLICGRDVDATGMTAGSNQLMGGFWSDIAKKSTGAKRTSLDQARMQLLQQLLAAELNASAFGSVPSGGSGMFATWENILCNGTASQVKNAMQQAASFNTAGDSSTFTPGTSADSKTGRFVADIVFWNIIKP